jgi:hypothetical protein
MSLAFLGYSSRSGWLVSQIHGQRIDHTIVARTPLALSSSLMSLST